VTSRHVIRRIAFCPGGILIVSIGPSRVGFRVREFPVRARGDRGKIIREGPS
jgi:hypothetical protein